MKPSSPTTRDAEFGQFAASFGDDLHRLAVLLVDDDRRAQALVVRSLAALRRRWVGIESSGAPELQAVDALVSRLPRRSVESSIHQLDHDEDDDFFQRQQAILRGWSALRPRDRAALLFTDASVVSQRMAGAPMPRSLGSAHRVQTRAAQCWQALQAQVRADPALQGWHFDDDEFGVLLADALRAWAAGLPAYLTPAPDIARRGRHDLQRTALAAAAVLVVMLAVGVAAAHFSTPHGSGNAAAAGISASAIVPPGFTNVQPPAASRAAGAQVAAHTVVDWPTRGTLAGDATLGSAVTQLFAVDHPGATGPIQLLLLTDTPTFRVAYVRAQTPDGSIGAWFYGDIGSDRLVEGASDLGFSILGPDTVISAVLVHDGTRELVTLSSPTARSMVLRGGSAPTPFLDQQGVGVLDVSRFAENGGLQVTVTESDGTSSVSLPQTVNLDQQLPEVAGDSTAGYPTMRGNPDPTLLIAADNLAKQWQADHLADMGVPVVLWGGTDGDVSQVVVRLRTTGPLDVAVIALSGPTPDGEAGADSESVLLNPTTPDFPLTWIYPDGDRNRVGVLAPIGVAGIQLFSDGAAAGQVAEVDANGYASVELPTGAVNEEALTIVLTDAAGHRVSTLSVQAPE